jgi:hypothetical protein
VSATGPSANPGANFLISCDGITNNGTVDPADTNGADDTGTCAPISPPELFEECSEFGVNCFCSEVEQTVVINEINWGGSSSSGADEWIELRNMTGSAINIGDWWIENLGTGGSPVVVIPAGSTIPANGFFLISNFNQATSDINVPPDVVTTAVEFDNAGEQLTLKSDLGTTIDTANGSGAWFFGTSTNPRKSMERLDPPGIGTQSANWQVAVTHTGMDGATPTDEFGTPKNINGL